ncbi:MAG: hypothetical protein KC418_18225 [Anaerolineales bacterium]|nr:hypothetical protein [Anaerolineales bacterium]
MTTKTLTHIEVTGIQNYIFGSNNLQQNIGASELVRQVTQDWVANTLNEMGKRHNLRQDEKTREWLPVAAAADDEAEVIYARGGNALILFAGIPDDVAIPFVQQLSLKAIQQARQLSLVVGHCPLNWERDALSQKHVALRQQVALRKQARSGDTPLLGLGVTAACVFTGMPAVKRDRENDDGENGQRISTAIKHKLCATQNGNDRLKRSLPLDTDIVDEFLSDFTLFGDRGEASYIAVVHADGNGMGKRFAALSDAFPRAADNEKYIQQVRLLSQKINEQALHALRETVRFLLDNYDARTDTFGGEVQVPEKNEIRYLPFRPLVFGGDDTTFVCDGRLGLSLAAHYLETLAQTPLPGPKPDSIGDPLYARAGIAVVKNHYPFSRAYELADDLSSSAKKAIKRITANDKGVTIDWHFATGGVILPLAQLRDREYTADNGKSLLMRPVRHDLGQSPPQGSRYWRSWDNFKKLTCEFQENKIWHQRRNKVKALQEALRRGDQAVTLFLNQYDIQDEHGKKQLPEIPGQSPTMMTSGWSGEDCGYFDAIEAIDFFVRLDKKKEAEE